MVENEKNESTQADTTDPTRDDRLSGRDIFDYTLSGALDRCRIPRLKSDPQNHQRLVHSLSEFRAQEGEGREERLKGVWRSLEGTSGGVSIGKDVGGRGDASFTRERAVALKEMYETELVGRCNGGGGPRDAAAGRVHPISWTEFYKYAEAKEVGT